MILTNTVGGYIIQFLLILAAIAVFFAPFIGAFWFKHRRAIRDKRPHFNHFMENFFESRYAEALVFTWAVGEALVWFVIPEFLLLLAIFMRRRRKAGLLAYDIAGTVVGTLVGLALRLPEKFLLKVPYVYDAMFTETRRWYSTEGLLALFHQPFSGVPYKVFVALASGHDFFIPAFIGLAIAVRLARYVLFYGMFTALYPLLHRLVYRHYGLLFVIAIAVFTLMLMKVSALYAGY